jgi:hypothetical protein
MSRTLLPIYPPGQDDASHILFMKTLSTAGTIEVLSDHTKTSLECCREAVRGQVSCRSAGVGSASNRKGEQKKSLH